MKNINGIFVGLSREFLGGFCLCVLLPRKECPPKHINGFLAHPVPRQSPRFIYLYAFFPSANIMLGGGGGSWRHGGTGRITFLLVGDLDSMKRKLT